MLVRKAREVVEERCEGKATYCELVLHYFFTEVDYGDGRRGGGEWQGRLEMAKQSFNMASLF